MKYEQWFNEWLDNYIKPSDKSSTYDLYLRTAKLHIFPRIGDVELADLTPRVLQKFITDLTVNGNTRTGKGLSPNSVKNMISLIQNTLKTANAAG